jgi:hypothetical protein
MPLSECTLGSGVLSSLAEELLYGWDAKEISNAAGDGGKQRRKHLLVESAPDVTKVDERNRRKFDNRATLLNADG